MTHQLVGAALASLLVTGCGAPLRMVRAPDSILLHDTDGSPRTLDAELRGHAYTAVSFFSAHCACNRAHDARIRELIAKDAPLGVGFLWVDSEESATVSADAEESKARGYRIVLDDAAKLARALEADYATYSVVLDRDGHVLYRGGFDSDRSHLRADRTEYLSDALDDLLAGRPVRRPETHALGCSLEVR
jgi:hypothetical protein